MQVQSKNTLSINDLLGTKAQGSEAEAENTQQGDFVFSDVLGKAVSGKNSETSSDLSSELTEDGGENLQDLDISENIEFKNNSDEVTSKADTKNLNIEQLLKNNSDNSNELNIENKSTNQTEKGLLTKSGLKLQSLLSKNKNELENVDTADLETVELTKANTDKKSFLKEILGKVTKTDTANLTAKASAPKASDLRINSDIHPAILNAEISKKKNLGVNQYKKEINSLNESLVRSPIHSELLENNKLQDENGFSKMHASELSDQSISNNIEAMQSSDLGQGSDRQSDNFSSGKVLDLSQIKAESKSALIKEVSNYIEQSYVANQDSVDLVVKHDELGSFRIHAQKSGPGNQVDLEINTASKQAEAFFHENESELIKNLQSGGVKLSSVKVVAKTEFLFTMEGGKSGNMEQSQDSGRDQSFHGRGEQKNQSSSQKFSDGRDRREELWQQAQEFNRKYAA